MPQYTVEITESCVPPVADHAFLDEVIRRVLTEQQIDVATISLALVGDAEIHAVNRDFLGHDWPTDVISFRLNDTAEPDWPQRTNGVPCSDRDSPDLDGAIEKSVINGELVVSTETAEREATAHGWSLQAELVLYVVHGLLHLCGFDDLTDEARPVMRSRERDLLAIWGFSPTGLES